MVWAKIKQAAAKINGTYAYLHHFYFYATRVRNLHTLNYMCSPSRGLIYLGQSPQFLYSINAFYLILVPPHKVPFSQHSRVNLLHINRVNCLSDTVFVLLFCFLSSWVGSGINSIITLPNYCRTYVYMDYDFLLKSDIIVAWHEIWLWILY